MRRQLPLTSRTVIIRENRAGPDEDIVLNGDAIPKKDSAFDRHAIPNAYPMLDKRMGTNIAFIANDRAG